jgi:signal transduction histidine kinase
MRIQASADDERRRIERDLHVGAQHRLAALRIKLELAAEQMEDGTRSGDPAVLRTLIAEVDTALDVIGSLARGIYPAALDRGLVEAIRAAALQGPLPTTVLATGVGRYSRDLEGAVYFACLEALQNAAKHATGARVAVVEISCTGGVLRLDVHDDGAGYDLERATEGVGLTNMRDRLSAVGGELEIRSSPGRGTHVIATVPIGAVDR